MDPTSLVTGFISAQMARVQLAAAAKMMRMEASSQQDVAKLIDAAQSNMRRFASAGTGGLVDISV